jgi:hypothetical protein
VTRIFLIFISFLPCNIVHQIDYSSQFFCCHDCSKVIHSFDISSKKDEDFLLTYNFINTNKYPLTVAIGGGYHLFYSEALLYSCSNYELIRPVGGCYLPPFKHDIRTILPGESAFIAFRLINPGTKGLYLIDFRYRITGTLHYEKLFNLTPCDIRCFFHLNVHEPTIRND